MIFGDILVDKDGMIKGPFGSAVKRYVARFCKR